MKLCIPTEDDAGLTGQISDHFGSARWFTLVDSETRTTRSVFNREHGHRPGTCDAGAEHLGPGSGGRRVHPASVVEPPTPCARPEFPCT